MEIIVVIVVINAAILLTANVAIRTVPTASATDLIPSKFSINHVILSFIQSIIEDNVFIGGNCGIYEGTIVKENAVIGTGVIINASTALYDATTGEYIGKNENGQVVVPTGAVVVAGSRPITKGPGAEAGVHVYTPVIVKYRDSKTDASVTLEDILR